ncbi:hypothetical protein ACVRYP_00545 [Streptococcus rifensis]
MKKQILLGLLGLLIIGLAGLVWKGVKNDAADTLYDNTFTLTAEPIKTIYIDGLEQPATILVKETEASQTTVRVQGQIAQSNIANLEEQFGMDKDGNLFISFSKEGLSMTVMGDKPSVTIEIALAKGTSFEDFSLFTSNGQLDVTLPTSFDGHFTVKSKSGQANHPKNGENSDREAKIKSQKGDVTVTLED